VEISSTLEAASNDSKAADEKVTSSLSIQRRADLDEVFRPWLA
jgi:hypothetical protein